MADQVETQIVPKRGSLAFFEVTPTSYHEVALVSSQHKVRKSISGWLYGPTSPKRLLPATYERTYSYMTIGGDQVLENWINPIYLSQDCIQKIADQFCKESAVKLVDFFLPEAYERMLKEFKSKKYHYVHKSPANIQNYDMLDKAELDSPVGHFFHMLRSLQFSKLIQEYTTFNPDKFLMDVVHFKTGSYTLMRDEVNEPLGLDVMIDFFEAKAGDGSDTLVYFSNDGDDLPQLEAAPNVLKLVFRDEGAMRFQRLITRKGHSRYTLSMVYPL